VDVWVNPTPGEPYKIEMIPTQIFYDRDRQGVVSSSGLLRQRGHPGQMEGTGRGHQWRKAGCRHRARDAGGGGHAPAGIRVLHVRWRRGRQDTDGGEGPERAAYPVRSALLLHLLFSIVGADPKAEEAKVSVSDWASGNLVAATAADVSLWHGRQGAAHHQAFAAKAGATKEQQANPAISSSGTCSAPRNWPPAARSCDRALYPEDACGVKFGHDPRAWLLHALSMGVAARLKQDIEVEAKDRLTAKSFGEDAGWANRIAGTQNRHRVVWPEARCGRPVGIAGCFKQGFFVNEANLQKWLDARPAMTGRQISIAQALADKMKLTPEQITKACKLGECK